MRSARRWAIGVAGTALTLVLVPLLVQTFYDDWFKAHLPLLADVYSYRWTPAIITVLAFALTAALLIWPDLIRNLVRPSRMRGNLVRRTSLRKETYYADGTIVIESSDFVEGAADETLNDDVLNVPPGDVLD
jgi:hypothetical protein